jgi:hypothetical protein
MAPAQTTSATQRTIGMGMLGSAIALGTCAACAAVGVLPMAADVRSWAVGGLVLAAVLDAAIAVYFLRMSSPS